MYGAYGFSVIRIIVTNAPPAAPQTAHPILSRFINNSLERCPGAAVQLALLQRVDAGFAHEGSPTWLTNVPTWWHNRIIVAERDGFCCQNFMRESSTTADCWLAVFGLGVLCGLFFLCGNMSCFSSFWTLDLSPLVCKPLLLFSRIRPLLVPQSCHPVGLVTPLWHPWENGTIQDYLEAQERIPWDPGLDFDRFGPISRSYSDSFSGSLDRHVCLLVMFRCL